ncbi:MAG: hypothetical protein IJL63_08760 [Clostridia bacterium]|nr:hypothetical protein [Clostridia bacterium]
MAATSSHGGILVILCAFAIVLVLVIIVGFIGNRVTDGFENFLRKQKKNNKSTPNYSPAQSLASRYNNQHSAVNKPPQSNHAGFCIYCGSPLQEGSVYCGSCGAKQI